MQQVVIIGGGFAGFWSAMSAGRQRRELNKREELKITLISKDEYHSIRPRFYEADLAGTRIPIRNYLLALDIDFIVAEVAMIDTQNKRIYLADKATEIVYDGLILAAGSRLRIADIPGIERCFNVDTFEAASLLDRHLRNLAACKFAEAASRNLVVVGGGFTGLEVITSLPKRIQALSSNMKGFNFFLVEQSSELALAYSPEARRYIADQLNAAGIKLLLGEQVVSVETGKLLLSKAKPIETNTVIWATGLEASPLTASFKGERDELGRLYADKFLRVTEYPNVFAAGDVVKVLVDDRHYCVMSCQHAIPQGKVAGQNVVNTLLGKDLIPYLQPRYTTCLDLGENALLTVGWGRELKMLGADAKILKTQITTQWIYPATDMNETIEMSAPEILS